MIGLDSYSRQVFIYLDHILIYISLWIDCLFEIRKIAEFPLAFIAGGLQGHWRGFISRNYVVWPTFLLMNVFIALKGSHFWFLFIIGRGFAERQILKKWKWPYLLNWVEYFDKLLRKHWYWQDLAQEIAKWHFSLVEALPSSKFWKSDNGAISWTEWNNNCDEILHTHWYWQDVPDEIVKWHLRLVEFLPRFKFWKKWDYCKMTFIIGRGFAERQILKNWKWPYLLNWVEYFDKTSA